MASDVAGPARPARPKPILTPDAFDRLLSLAALVLLGAVLAALWRGRAEWGEVPAIVWVHIVTIGTATAMTPVMLLRRRGDRLHRRLGWVWVGAMALAAAFSFGIRGIGDGDLSLIHVLSAFTLAMLPVLVWSARTHRHARHRSTVRSMVAGAMLIAGFFTFPFERLLGRWLFG